MTDMQRVKEVNMRPEKRDSAFDEVVNPVYLPDAASRLPKVEVPEQMCPLCSGIGCEYCSNSGKYTDEHDVVVPPAPKAAPQAFELLRKACGAAHAKWRELNPNAVLVPVGDINACIYAYLLAAKASSPAVAGGESEKATKLLRDVMEAHPGYNCQGDCGECAECKARKAAWEYLNNAQPLIKDVWGK